MADFFQNLFMILGVVWVLLVMFNIRAIREEDVEDQSKPKLKTKALVNGVAVNMEDIVVAEAEFVEQNGVSVWLLWDYHTKKFLAQSTASEECVNILKQRFPNKTILIKGLPE